MKKVHKIQVLLKQSATENIWT